MKDGAEYLSAGDIARVIGKSIRTVRRWIKSGVLRSVKLGGSRLVAASDLERLLHPEVPE
jgi:excisionase family DNA binding protein